MTYTYPIPYVVIWQQFYLHLNRIYSSSTLGIIAIMSKQHESRFIAQKSTTIQRWRTIGILFRSFFDISFYVFRFLVFSHKRCLYCSPRKSYRMWFTYLLYSIYSILPILFAWFTSYINCIHIKCLACNANITVTRRQVRW